MAHPVLIAISIIITVFAFLLLIIYLLNKKFRSYPCYFNIIFTLSITLDNLIRLITGGKGNGDESDTNYTTICQIQAFTLTLFDKVMLCLMTSYSIIAYIGSYHLYFYKTHEKKIFIVLTIVSFLISLITTILFYINGISNRSQYCYVETKSQFKKILDTIVTSILLIISLFCIIKLLIKIKQLKQEKEYETETGDGNEDSVKSITRHLIRFILNLILTLNIFMYVICLINKIIDFEHFFKDLVYILLSLFAELFFTINMELIKEVLRIITCKKIEEDDEDQREQTSQLSDNYNEENET